MDNTDKSTTNTINPLPYVIIFAILFIIALGVLGWVLDVWYKANQCFLYPNIWCSDNWTCNNSCPTGFANSCFDNVGPTGLASCLFGPNAPGAKTCLSAPTGGLACECPSTVDNTVRNCFSMCASDLGSVNPQTTCCCKPGQANCPFTESSLPAQCRGTT